jgi:hypothetical protein
MLVHTALRPGVALGHQSAQVAPSPGDSVNPSASAAALGGRPAHRWAKVSRVDSDLVSTRST